MVLPSPTMMVNRRIKQATQQRKTILLTGHIMGGGPSQWAAEEHLHQGLPIYATPDAARSFNDDLEKIQNMGIHLLSDDEARQFSEKADTIHMRDFDYDLITRTFAGFGVSLQDLDAVAVAVFDHGAAPPEVSDRQLRFDYLDDRIRLENRLSAFAYPRDQIPALLTRLQAVADSAPAFDMPLVVMDTAPAAVLGTLFDPVVSTHTRLLIANVGNFHTLAFRLGPKGIEGVFEHHTGFLDLTRLEDLLERLAKGSLTHTDVFNSQGHGALIYSPEPLPLDFPDFNIVLTGPRRNMMQGSRLRPYFAVPFGDMMLAGCFGLLSATADLLPQFRDSIHALLNRGTGRGTAPWDVD
jgi:uncharacterized protein (DUF1786 family)